jgi:para-nitrobenzyl esterase
MSSLDAAPPFPPVPPGTPPVPVPVTANDRTVADRVSAYWFNFAKTGVPSPEWPKNEAGQDKTLLLGAAVSVATDFMQQHHADAKYENMEAFEMIGAKMDEIAAKQG